MYIPLPKRSIYALLTCHNYNNYSNLIVVITLRILLFKLAFFRTKVMSYVSRRSDCPLEIQYDIITTRKIK